MGGAMLPTFQVMKGMVTQPMPRQQQPLENMGVFTHIIAHTKKGGWRLSLREAVEHKRRRFGHGAVVESEINLPMCVIFSPQKMRE
jgi:hypothetical protein